MKKGKSEKLGIFFSLLLITSILSIIAKTPTASGYEISIYDAFPWYFWFVIIISYVIGIFLIFNEIFKNKKYNKFILANSFILMFIITIILLYLPWLRGYATYGRGDVLTHIGFTRDIIRTEEIPRYNWYPMVHILGANFFQIARISPNYTMMILPPIFSIIYIIGMFLFSKELFNEKIGIIVCGFSFFLIRPTSYIGIHFSPHGLSFFLFPLIMYSVFKPLSTKKNYLCLSLILISSYIIYHPLRALFFIIILLFLIVAYNYYKKINIYLDGKDLYTMNRFKGWKWMTTATFSAVIFYLWYFRFDKILRPFETLILGQEGVIKLEGYRGVIARASPQFSDLLILFTFRYGVMAIMFLLSIIIILLYIKKPYNFLSKYNFNIFFLFLFFSIFLIISIIIFLVPSPANFERFLDYTVVGSTVLIGFVFFDFHERNLFNNSSYNFKKYVKLIIYILIVLMIIISILSFYPSRFSASSNHQVTEMELSGMDWTFNNQNKSLSTVERSGSMQHRFSDALYGRLRRHEYLTYDDVRVPDHFGYNETRMLGNIYDEKTYLIIPMSERIFYPEIYPEYEEYWRFTPEDYSRLEKDLSVNRVYDNGEYNTYIILDVEFHYQ